MISPITIGTARAFTAWTHRHLAPPVDAEFVIGVQSAGGALVGVAFVDRPICRAFDDGHTAEVTCLSTDGTPNACSALLGAAWRLSRAKGYRRLIAHTRTDEPGTSLRAAGFRRVAHPAARWDKAGRADRGAGLSRILWEITVLGGRS
ncbi:hypothetical protein LDL08_19765 [Nonomuraea glycinis]|nr:XF1762 family protein [Nonomuraea glycinis]MCA2178429.1 hypothetical protein [Nonomuraea glycinis]